jgi:hypothetical protein
MKVTKVPYFFSEGAAPAGVKFMMGLTQLCGRAGAK